MQTKKSEFSVVESQELAEARKIFQERKIDSLKASADFLKHNENLLREYTLNNLCSSAYYFYDSFNMYSNYTTDPQNDILLELEKTREGHIQKEIVKLGSWKIKNVENKISGLKNEYFEKIKNILIKNIQKSYEITYIYRDDLSEDILKLTIKRHIKQVKNKTSDIKLTWNFLFEEIRGFEDKTYKEILKILFDENSGIDLADLTYEEIERNFNKNLQNRWVFEKKIRERILKKENVKKLIPRDQRKAFIRKYKDIFIEGKYSIKELFNLFDHTISEFPLRKMFSKDEYYSILDDIDSLYFNEFIPKEYHEKIADFNYIQKNLSGNELTDFLNLLEIREVSESYINNDQDTFLFLKKLYNKNFFYNSFLCEVFSFILLDNHIKEAERFLNHFKRISQNDNFYIPLSDFKASQIIEILQFETKKSVYDFKNLLNSCNSIEKNITFSKEESEALKKIFLNCNLSQKNLVQLVSSCSNKEINQIFSSLIDEDKLIEEEHILINISFLVTHQNYFSFLLQNQDLIRATDRKGYENFLNLIEVIKEISNIKDLQDFLNEKLLLIKLFEEN